MTVPGSAGKLSTKRRVPPGRGPRQLSSDHSRESCVYLLGNYAAKPPVDIPVFQPRTICHVFVADCVTETFESVSDGALFSAQLTKQDGHSSRRNRGINFNTYFVRTKFAFQQSPLVRRPR